MLDGLNIGSPPGGNTATSYVVDVGAAQEVTFVSTGGLGDAETGGVVMSIISGAAATTRTVRSSPPAAEARCSRTT